MWKETILKDRLILKKHKTLSFLFIGQFLKWTPRLDNNHKENAKKSEEILRCGRHFNNKKEDCKWVQKLNFFSKNQIIIFLVRENIINDGI